MVYVKGYNGNPLYPTTRCGHVRWLLKMKLAKVVQTKPFTIQLLYKETNLYETPDHMKTVMGIDPGRKNIGISVVTKGGQELYSAKVETRNAEISDLLKDRAKNRSNRRQHQRQKRRRRAKKCGTTTTFPNGRKLPGCEKPIYPKDIRNSEARFLNRKRTHNWITPSVRQLVHTHVKLIQMVADLIPIDEIVFEVNKFAFMKLEDSTCIGYDFQHGRLCGYKDMYDYIDNRQGHTCCLCGNNPIDHYHHLVKTSDGGSDLPENVIGVCIHCHEMIHKGLMHTELDGIKKKYHHLSVLNTATPFIIRAIKEVNIELHLCSGYATFLYRNAHSIVKDHNRDAACIAALYYDIPVLRLNDSFYTIKQFRAHNRQIIHCQRERTYYYGRKAVAKNRKARFEQEMDSLQTWLNGLQIDKTQKQQLLSCFNPIKAVSAKNPTGVVRSTRIYNRMDRILPGATFIYKKKRYVLAGTRSKIYYQPVGSEDKILISKCKIIKKNKGLVYM